MTEKPLVFLTLFSVNIYNQKKPEVYLVTEETASKVAKQFASSIDDKQDTLIKFDYHNIQNGLGDIRAVIRKSSSVSHIEFHPATEEGNN
jgi:hypothetical protein